MQVTEQTLRALGAATCADLLALRGVLAALYSAISSDFFVAAALGIGRTRHTELVREGEVRSFWGFRVLVHMAGRACFGRWHWLHAPHRAGPRGRGAHSF